MESKMIYLITGAGGHLGMALAALLAERGCRIRALCRPGSSHYPPVGELCYGDVCEGESLDAFFKREADEELTVIHCAGLVSIAGKFDPAVYRVNVEGTKNVVDACVKHGVKKLLYVSSVHAIPELPKGTTMTEECEFSPKTVDGLYAKTKAEATMYVLEAAKRGLDARVLFPSGIIGPGDRGGSHTNAIVADYLSGRLTAAVRGGYDFVDVRDVAQGIYACAQKGRAGEGYILSGGFHSIREILTTLHELSGVPEVRVYLPVSFIMAMAPLCELYYKLRGKPPLFTAYSMKVLKSNAAFSNLKARTQLGFEPRTLKETLRDTIEWMQEER